MATRKDIWVFAYGSLMWRPEFAYVDSQPALLRGYHRSLCLYSIHYRGMPKRPGLVLGLDRGGSCRGRALRVRAGDAGPVLEYLIARELVNGVYRQVWLPVMLAQGPVEACTFIVERRHSQYAGKLSAEEAARLVAAGEGLAGTALDYLRNTVAHLDDLGLAEGPLHAILDRAERLAQAEREKAKS